MPLESGAYHRQGEALTNFDSQLPKPQSDLAREALKAGRIAISVEGSLVPCASVVSLSPSLLRSEADGRLDHPPHRFAAVRPGFYGLDSVARGCKPSGLSAACVSTTGGTPAL